MEGLVGGIAFVIVFSSILFLAYVTTKYIGKKTNRVMKGKYVTVIETVSLGFDNRLHLVKVADDFMLISSAGKNIQMLKTVELDEQKKEIDTNNPNTVNFKDFFNKYLKNFKSKNANETIENSDKNVNAGDDRNLKGEKIKKNLKRLKELGSDLQASKTTEDGDEYTNENKAELS
ncbi:flagellar biosynthetic protein FliO [Herbivorax sp. ANBcel31]|uniref:flagellar biosynthetic protein FliO n=1 Tax=Herbivorax sp. ANBcel31 TaxID=3069754 RepID=UPI0027B26BC1|nr:flagellar biosynthetic protein FliO [Herbivorax sp. ANBcel31]MDQ2085882.1 flagellar biosynthetic protein FliO [Herbivorax sp. ANBcel31]